MPSLQNFSNLPSIVVYKDDGNLRVLETIPGNITLVLGTSPAGPVGQVHLVRATDSAENIFDPNRTKEGNLLQGMYEAIENGAQYVALYRIGAAPAGLELNGYTIVFDEASTAAGKNFKVFYKTQFGGGSQDLLRIFDATSGQIIFDSITGTNNGTVTVYGSPIFTTGVAVGTDANDASKCPSLYELEDISNVRTNMGSATGSLIAGTENIEFTGAENLGKVKAGSILEVNNKYYLVNYVTADEDGTREVAVIQSELTLDATSKTLSLKAGEVSFAALANTPVKIKCRYIAAKTGLGMTLNQTFTAYARAYWELESSRIDFLIPKGVFVDAPNVVDNNGKVRIGAIAGDHLGKVYEFEHNGQYFHIFKSTFSNTNDKVATEIPSPYEVGLDGAQAHMLVQGIYNIDTILATTSVPGVLPAADITYGEANFAHQAAEFLHGLSVNETEAHGFFSMVAPINFAKPTVAKWLGKLPQYDINTGAVTVNGSGVLGYKFMAGTTDVAAGFYHTSTGLVDGTPVLDRNQMPIDIGQYISITAMPLIIRSAYKGLAAGYIGEASAVYAGIASSLDVREAPTNKKFGSKIVLPFRLSKEALNALTGLQYVAFTNAVDGSVKVVDAPTAARPTSDYRRFLTVRTVGMVLDLVRTICEPYIGKITSGEIRMALQDEINRSLKELATEKYIKAANAEIRATRDMEIKGEAGMKLDIVDNSELRRLTIYNALRK